MGAGTSIRLTWDRGDVRWIAVGDLIFGVLIAVTSVAILLIRGPIALPFAAMAAPFLWSSERAFSVLRSGPPSIDMRADGSMVISHPLWTDRMHLTADDIHSVWLEPFEEERELTRREFWAYQAPMFDGTVRLMSSLVGALERQVLIVFTRPLSYPTLRMSEWNFLLHRTSAPIHYPLTWKHPGRPLDATGIVVTPDVDPERSPVFAGRIRPGLTMPDDVRAWVA